MITILSDQSSIISQYMRELRDETLQKDQTRFGQNLEKLGMIAGYELSKRLDYKDHATETPLGTANTPILKDKVVLATVLRAGLPLQHGLQQVFTNAEQAFVGAGRKENTGKGVEIDLSYMAAPRLDGKVLILADTMLATGNSLVDAYHALIQNGTPSKVFIVSVIASQAGVDFLTKGLPEADLFICAIDEQLNGKYYIVPGLGDAGDLLYGSKL